MNGAAAEPAVVHQRVGWLELFYDLVFVVVIERLTHLVHGDPSWSLIWTCLGLTFVVWLAWFNVSAMTNVSGEVGPRGRPLLFVSMAGMGVLAIGVGGVTEGHFWLFVIGYVIARAATWPLWLRGRVQRPAHLARALPYVPFLLATLAVGFLHQVWLLVVALVMLATAEIGFSFGGRGDAEGQRLHGPHMVERIGLLLLLVLGECVVQIVNALDEDHREPVHWVTAACAVALLCALWWLVYDATVSKIEAAMDRDDTSIPDFIGGAQLAIASGLVLMAAGMADAVHSAKGEEGAAHLHSGSLTCLCLGMFMVGFGTQSLSRRAFAAGLGTPTPSQRKRERGTLESPHDRRRHDEARAAQGWEDPEPSMRQAVAGISQAFVFYVPVAAVWFFGGHWAPWVVLIALFVYVIANVFLQAMGTKRITAFVESGGFEERMRATGGVDEPSVGNGERA